MPLPLFALLAGCAPPPYTPPAASDTSTEDADDSGGDTDSGEPGLGIRLLHPPPEQAVTGCVMVVADITGIDVIPAPGTGNVPGQGHWHVEYAGTYVVCDKPYCLVGFDGLPEGNTVLNAVLVDNEHGYLLGDDGEPVQANVLVNVSSGECAEGTPVVY